MNPGNLAVTTKVQDILTAIEQSVANTKRAKSLIRQVDTAKAAGKFIDPEVQQAYLVRINNSLRTMRESHILVNPKPANWTERTVNVIKRLQELSGEAIVKTSDDKIFTLSSEQLKNIGTIRELKSDMALGIGEIPLDMVDGEIFKTILQYLVDPKSVVITKDNIVDLYNAGIYLDITSPTAGGISLSKSCLKSAEHLLELKHFTSEFCKNTGFAHFFKNISEKKKNAFIMEYSQELASLEDNLKRIAPYVSSLIFSKKTEEDVFSKFSELFCDKDGLLKNIKDIYIRLEGGDFSEEDIKCFNEISKNKKMVCYLYQNSKHLNSICKISSLVALTVFIDRKEINCSFLPADGMNNISSLSIIDLNAIQPDKLEMLAKKCPKLEKLYLKHVNFETLPTGFPELKVLSIISNSSLTGDGLLMANSYPKLEEIDISQCVNVKTFPAKLSKTFKKLSSRGSGLSEEQKKNLIDIYKLKHIE